MNGPDEDGVYTLEYNLRPGEHQYKFLINGEQWFHDPSNELNTADGHGGQNSIINVGEKDLEKAQTGDGKINKEFILHDSENRVHLNKLSKNSVQIRLKTRKNVVPEWHQGIKENKSSQIDPANFTNYDPSIHPKSGWRIFYGGDLQGDEFN